MRAPFWHLRNNFWRWWYGGARWSRWAIIGAGALLVAAGSWGLMGG